VSGGWDIIVTQSPNNPLGDFRQSLAQNGGNTSAVNDVAALWGPTQVQPRVRMEGAEGWATYGAWGLSHDFIDRSDLPLQTRATAYADDRAVWDAVRDAPDLAVVDANTIPSSASFGNVGGFVLEGVTTDDTVMEPTRIELNDPATGAIRTIIVVGVLDSSVGAFGGVFMSQDTFGEIYPTPGVNAFVVKLQPGLDAKQEADQIEATLVTYGAQATSFKVMIDEASRSSRGLMQIIQGFMLLGLIVGIAALGVISFRSVVERRQQIGMLRAIGYRRSMVVASFMIESTMVTILGVLSGVILGLVLAWQLMTSEYFFGSSDDVHFTVPWLQVTLFIVIALVAALLMSWIPARRAARVPIAEALRYE
jgi:putative ABC transport system permease protein